MTAVEQADRPAATDPTASLEEATGTARDLLVRLYAMLPKIVIAIVLIAAAAALAGLVRGLLRRTLSRWEKVEAISALVRIGLSWSRSARR